MKVLFAIDSLVGEGAQKLINDIATLFSKKGHNCSVMVLTDKDEKYIENLEANGVSVVVVPNGCLIKKLSYMYRYIQNFDIVHCNLFPMFYYISIVRRFNKNRGGVPYLLMTEHSVDNRRRHKKYLNCLEKIIYSEFNKIICISQKTKEFLQNWLGNSIENSRYEVIYNGINIEEFYNAKAIKKTQLFSDIGDDDILLGMVGRFVAAKNHKFMIEIMTKLPERYKLILVGVGPMFEEINKLVKDYNLQRRVKFLGYRSDISTIMKTIDVLVVPSLYEGFGLVAAEAMAAGTPVVAADIPGLSEVVSNAGILVPQNNIEEFCNAIGALESQSEYDEICQKAIKQSKKFNIVKTAEMYEKIFFDMVAREK